MEIRHTLSQGIVILTPAGRLNAASSAVFLDYCATLPAVPAILDLSEITSLSSTGLRALLRFRKERTQEGADVVIPGSRGLAYGGLRRDGFDRIFRLYPSAADAVAAIVRIVSPAPGARGSA